MNKFTPGPWTAKSFFNCNAVVDANDNVVCTVGPTAEDCLSGMEQAVVEAKVNMVAIAALPELLEALRDLVTQVNHHASKYGESALDTAYASAIIAKATS